MFTVHLSTDISKSKNDVPVQPNLNWLKALDLDVFVDRFSRQHNVTVHGSVCSFCVRLCCGPARCACQRCLVTVHLPR